LSTIYYSQFHSKLSTFQHLFKFYNSASLPTDDKIESVTTALLFLVILKWFTLVVPLFVPGIGWAFCFLVGYALVLYLFAGMIIMSSFAGYLLLAQSWGNSLSLFRMGKSTAICAISGGVVFLSFACFTALLAARCRAAAAVAAAVGVAALAALAGGLASQAPPACWESAKAHQRESTIAGLCAAARSAAAAECRAEALFRRCIDADRFFLLFRVEGGLVGVPAVIAVITAAVYWIVQCRAKPELSDISESRASSFV
jgi:hypothetical protein